ncbi:hypothetical protein B0H63DRAFT_447140 [Podospora didyma]|uniref:Uncharacterized protein n=1 Tax=Podospora didyma TaxID=330526 RepID=A0AAE0P0K7_9PEZI|nr:hypothetical protein B0H63DRAFT_447140 [Podospora didyma]
MKPSKLIPPDPRPSKAHPEHRSQRKAVEKEHGAGAFEWVSAVALLLAGMTILIDVEKDVKKCEERREREQREREHLTAMIMMRRMVDTSTTVMMMVITVIMIAESGVGVGGVMSLSTTDDTAPPPELETSIVAIIGESNAADGE